MDINDLFGADTLSEDLQARKNTIEQLIERLKQEISESPEGTLRITKNRKKHQYFHRQNQHDPIGTYLPVKNYPTAVKLAQKEYDIKLLALLEDQLKAIDKLLKNYKPGAVMQLYECLNPQRKSLVTPIILTDEKYVKQWLNKPYNKMGFGKDDPEYYTSKGERVRSKSELLIAEALIRYNIPYRYEFPVYHNGVLLAVPDFNCLNVRQRKDYYWEHLGMLADPNYANKNVKKLERYSLAPDFDESSLILTMETNKHPLNTRVIEEKIKRFLL
ncbi:MAG: hypothetical protein K6D93_05125 [Saccharofermentans sp.]|nr:hypothetical protein [Saccharofermentans sp.]